MYSIARVCLPRGYGDNSCERLRDFFEKFGREIGLDQNHPNENVTIAMQSGNVVFITESQQPYYIDQANLTVEEILTLKSALNDVPDGKDLVLSTRLIKRVDGDTELTPEQEDELLKGPKALANSTEFPNASFVDIPDPGLSLLEDKDKNEIDDLAKQDHNTIKFDSSTGDKGVKKADSSTQTIHSRSKDGLSSVLSSDLTASKPILKDIVKVSTPYKLINYTRSNVSEYPPAERANLFINEVKRNCDAANGKLREMSGVYDETISKQNEHLAKALSDQKAEYEKVLQNHLRLQDERVAEQLRQQRDEFRSFMSEIRTTMGVQQPPQGVTVSHNTGIAQGPQTESLPALKEMVITGGTSVGVTTTSTAPRSISLQNLADTRTRENQVTGDSASSNFITVAQLNTLLDDKIKQNLDSSKNNSSLESVSEEIKLTLSTKGEGVKRDYKLTDELNFEHFYDFFTMELRTNNLLHIVKPEIQEGVNLDESVLEK
ncbi:hypothetical protein QAD02_007308 [Eretmocerus hayati]|uniref:Uncharacterized protein n=1 Tax=Eretmocerus hayati TaxID=131215 RepID=A0ACC2N3L1_9HYME|nr:hypothetical protein QAD02_007308 [Eretmocerus hayati]